MSIITIICILAFIVLILDIKAVFNNSYVHIKVISSALLLLSFMRYINLLLFTNGASTELLYKIQYFYFITYMIFPILFMLVLWYITPFYRQKINAIYLYLLYMPWIIFYMALSVLKPYRIIKSNSTGYVLVLQGKWGIYLNVAQSIFCVIFIIASIYAYNLYKHKQVRSQYLVLIICQLLFLVDGIIYLGYGSPLIQPFTLTEVFGFLGIYYGFARSPIDARGIHRK